MKDGNRDKKTAQDKEFEGNTVEEAILSALEKLKTSREKIKIQVINEGHRGLFGMEGVKRAKIRVTILPEEKQNDDVPRGTSPA